MLLIASRSASQGRAAGFASLAGIQVGTYCHALAAAFGLSQLFLAVPLAYDIVRYAGAAYLLYLAWKAFFFGKRNGINSGRAASSIPGRPDVSPGATDQHSQSQDGAVRAGAVPTICPPGSW